MCGRILVLWCVFLAAITQSGCFGLGVITTAECKTEAPFTGVYDLFGTSPIGSTKAEFLKDKDWGKPDEIISPSENEETWIYNRKRWCGVVPIILLPVPLILPVCDGFDRIEFQGNEAKRLHTKRNGGGVVYIAPWHQDEFWKPFDCRFPPPPKNGVDSDATKPTAQVTP
jgi:hypothetical protein